MIDFKFWTWRKQLRDAKAMANRFNADLGRALERNREVTAQWSEQVTELRSKLEHAGINEQNAKLISSTLKQELKERLAEMRKLDARIEAVYQRTPAITTKAEQERRDLERWTTLAGFEEEHPLWQTVLQLADEHERNEALMALRPDLVDGTRQYNSGRAAGASDFASALREVFVLAHQKARKEQREA